MTFEAIRDQFPISREEFCLDDGTRRQIVYLDHGASTHPPQPVIDGITEFVSHHYANIHRGNHYLSRFSSDEFDRVSEIVCRYIGADPKGNEIIFTMNTTTAIDIASYLMGDVEGATIVTEMEHHSNDLPHRRRGETLRVGVLDNGKLDVGRFEDLLKNNRVKLVAVTGASNVTGYMPDIHEIARLAHRYGARILVDAAQLLAHKRLDVRSNDADDHIDFVAAAGHKAYAPFGAAFLLAPTDVCNAALPYVPGGGTVEFVTNENILWASGQDRHLGGTPNVPGVVAMGQALEWLSDIGLDRIREHELSLLKRTIEELRGIEGVELLGDIDPEERLGVIPFNIKGIKDPITSSVLNSDHGVATRNGCFCAHPYMTRLLCVPDAECVYRDLLVDRNAPKPGAVRASIGIFNNESDLSLFAESVRELAADPESAAKRSDVAARQCTDFA